MFSVAIFIINKGYNKLICVFVQVSTLQEGKEVGVGERDV